MNIEYEARILNINKNEIRSKLESLGATFKFDCLQQRYTYDFNPVKPKKWIRLRTNGIETTLTTKDITSDKIDGTKELEIEGKNEKEIMEIVNLLGFKKEDITSKDVQSIYLDYGIDINKNDKLELESERK